MENNWIKKVWNRLFDLDEEQEVDQKKDPDIGGSIHSEHHQRIDRKHSIGRMENGDRKNEARIVHQYPRDGNFRFPLIPDQSNNRKQQDVKKDHTERKKNEDQSKISRTDQRPQGLTEPKSKKQVQSRNSKRKPEPEVSDSSKSKKFSGVNFKPSDIPSPIYGFSKRPVVEKMEDAVKTKNTASNHQYTPLDKNKVINKLIQEPELTSKEDSRSELLSNHLEEKKAISSESDIKLASSSIEVVNSDEQVIEKGVNEDKVASEAHLSDDTVEEIINHGSNNESHDESVNELLEENDTPIIQNEEQEETLYQSETEDVPEEESVLEEITDESYRDEIESSVSEEVSGYISSDSDEVVQKEEQEEILYQSETEDVPVEENIVEEMTDESHGDDIERTESEEMSEHVPSDSDQIVSNEKVTNESEEQSSILEDHQEENESNETDEKQELQDKREESRPKPQVPYNVMMLANDRRHITKKPVAGGEYKLPPISLLDIPPRNEGSDDQWLEEQRELLESTLQNFNVQARVVGATMGPTVTRFEVQPSPGVKVNKITNLSDDIKLSLAARDIRMEAPIPGKNAIGIEVPNPTSKPVFIREIVRSGAFQSEGSLLNAALGFDIAGEAKITDIQKMPHGLIAGATGSGKSVCINSILISLLLKANPNDVKMMLIDPKMVELAPYNGLPHLVTPVINDVKEATTALKWAVDEMEERYEKFAAAGVRDIKRYNERAINHGEPQHKLPYIVIVIDELADLMMVSPQDVEDAICRIAQKARACGIHLLVATQRPSVDVITGLIKANIPTRIAFSVSSQIDSRTILDTSGAEKLLGKGDMLCLENGSSKPVRLQGNFVSDEEIERVTSFVRKQRKPNYLIKKEDLMKKQQYNDQEDDLFEEACIWAMDQGQASSSALQRRFRIGFNRAARLIEMMEERGLVSEAMGSKPRSILISKADFEETFLKDMHA